MSIKAKAPSNAGSGDIPLKFAAQLSRRVNAEWESGALLDKVTPVTKDLLRFWLEDAFCAERPINFHKGQRQVY